MKPQKQLSIENLNEADVREELIGPLLRRLGYQSHTSNDIIREQSLRYPRVSLGRKNSRRDPLLRGIADYILEVDKRIRWVIEAKATSEVIDADAIEQAWTYANHPEIRAVYFAICNGRTFELYITAHGPETAPHLSLPVEHWDSDFQVIENVVGPTSLLTEYGNRVLDVGLPIAPGLRSVARVTNGSISYCGSNIGLEVFQELQSNVRSGAVERGEDGLIALVKVGGPSKSIQELNDRLGLSTFEMLTTDKQLSQDSSCPTIFTYTNIVTIPAGEKLLDIRTWTHFELPMNLTCNVTAEASGVYECGVFKGTFRTTLTYPFQITIKLDGIFEMFLA
jgi:hypothetical protein